MSIAHNRLFLAATGAVVSLVLAVGPVVFIRHGLLHFTDHWQEVAFYVTFVIGGAAGGAMGFNLSTGVREIPRQRRLVWGTVICFLLYMSCTALCEKINFGTIDTGWWRTAGLVIFLAGVILREWAIARLGRLHSGFVAIQPEHKLVRNGLYRIIRHPSYLGALVTLVGMPMVFGTWFPLLAIPGAFVAVRWRIEDEESLLAEEFGGEFQEYKKGTWRMIPYLY